MVSNRYLWSSWNGCHYDYYDWVIEAFSVKVTGQQWTFWTMPTSHMVQRFHWLSGRTWTIWQGNSRHPDDVFGWIVKKRLMWLLQYDLNQSCPDFYLSLIIIGHWLLCHYCGTILVWSWWETSLIICLGFVILWSTGSLVSWLSRFVLKIYSGDLTFKIVFATVALLALLNDHVAWVWINLWIWASQTHFFFSLQRGAPQFLAQTKFKWIERKIKYNWWLTTDWRR